MRRDRVDRARRVVSALHSGVAIDWTLRGQSYLWMLPIYGGGCLLFERVHAGVMRWPWPLRAALYVLGCFAIEYGSGFLIEQLTGSVPWDYSGARWHVHGKIRLDYAPAWFAFGLLLERVERLVRAAERGILA